MQHPTCIRSGPTVVTPDNLSARAAAVLAAKRATNVRCYPDPTKFPLRGYFFFFFADFFFAFFAFLAMLPSVIPKSSLDASRESTCMRLDYTTIAKLILLASNKVNGHQIVLTCDGRNRACCLAV
jgi:hypothetical protein